jgi:hypothetical protein
MAMAFSLWSAATGHRFLHAMLNSGDQSPHSKSCRRLNPIEIRYRNTIRVVEAIMAHANEVNKQAERLWKVVFN